MKLDHVDKSKSFTRRLLNDFSSALFELLQENKLEGITISQLCEKTDYPRSTFYNYFEDIYALMDYCWESLGEKLNIDKAQSIKHDERTLVLFNDVYDFIEENRKTIDKLLWHNKSEGAMLTSFDRYVRRMIYKIVIECPFSYKYPVPNEIVAEHYSNTVQMVLSACFLDKTITKTQALSYVDFLLGTLEKASTRK